MEPRWSCVCCALPEHLVRYAHAKSGDGDHSSAQEHEATTAALRSKRHVKRSAPTQDDCGLRAIYDAGSAKKLPGVLARAEGGRRVHDAVVNDAYRNIGITLDFFHKVLGRHSLDGNGIGVKASVHFGKQYPNAMWTGREMLFGDGDGVQILGFAHSLDIVGHELTHAVTHHSVRRGLGVVRRNGKVNLEGEAGALNESFSDVFASMITQWHRKQDVESASWLVGEGVLAPHVGRAVRSLKDPGNPRLTYPEDNQVGSMDGYVEGGDSHVNSGIANRAFYLAARKLGGNSWEQLGAVWYRALQMLVHDATFRDAAVACGEAAASLHGVGSPAQRAVLHGWRRVGVLLS